jgi:murein L,D-transpeptidase YcbB/YkuD
MKSGPIVAALLAWVCCQAAALPVLAKGKDSWLTQGAFQRAQERALDSQRRGGEEDAFSIFEEEQFEDEEMDPSLPQIFTPGKRKRRGFGTIEPLERPEIFAPPDQDSAEFDSFDPEPDFSIIEGKPKSPDDGFETYEPPKGVPLSNPKLQAGIFDDPLASNIFQALRNPEQPISVTRRQRDAIIKFYVANSFRPLWMTKEGPSDRAKLVLNQLSKAEEDGLSAIDYLIPGFDSFGDLTNARGDAALLARLETGLTAMAVRYAEHLYSGRLVPNKLSGYHDLVPPVLDLDRTLRRFFTEANPGAYMAELAPLHPAYHAMKAALAELQAVADPEEDEQIAAGERVKVGGRDARVPMVRERMVKLGLLSEEEAPAWMLGNPAEGEDPSEHERQLDKELSRALKEFQANNGIKQTGQIDDATIDALNSPADRASAEKLALNMERLRWMPRDLGNRYIWVNQAAFELAIVDQEKIIWRTKVIVGKPETQTYLFNDLMETVVMNPYWVVPKSIIKQEMLPHLMEDPSYLDRKGFEVVTSGGEVISSSEADWWSYGDDIPYDVRQPPGGENALGRIKFLFPNSHSIYMHDTPTKKLFNEKVRAFSHGCIRVENPRKLAEYVLGWDRQRIDDLIASGSNREIKLDKKIPVYLTYFTVWPDESGEITVYRDAYKRDERLERAVDRIAMASN